MLLALAAPRLPALLWSVPVLGGGGRLRSTFVSLVVVSFKYVVRFVVRTYLIQEFCLAIIFRDILFGRRAHSWLGWLQWSCGGSFGASTSRFSFVQFEIADAPSGSHTCCFLVSSSQHVIAQHGIP